MTSLSNLQINRKERCAIQKPSTILNSEFYVSYNRDVITQASWAVIQLLFFDLKGRKFALCLEKAFSTWGTENLLDCGLTAPPSVKMRQLL